MVAWRSSAQARHAENEGEEHRETADDDVGDSQEIILTAEGIACGKHEMLLALEWRNLELIVDLDLIFTSIQASFNFSPQFTEFGKTSCSHPNDEMFVSHVYPLDIFPSSAIWRLLHVLVSVLNIRLPSDTILVNWDLLT